MVVRSAMQLNSAVLSTLRQSGTSVSMPVAKSVVPYAQLAHVTGATVPGQTDVSLSTVILVNTIISRYALSHTGAVNVVKPPQVGAAVNTVA